MAAAILRNVRMFSLLLDLCNSAVRHLLQDAPESVYWNSLYKYAKELSEDRNYLVHRAMVFHGTGPGHFDGEHRIGPNLLAVLAGSDENRLPMDVPEIRELLADFQELVELLVDFESALKQNATSHEKYLAPLVRRRLPRHQRMEAAVEQGNHPP